MTIIVVSGIKIVKACEGCISSGKREKMTVNIL